MLFSSFPFLPRILCQHVKICSEAAGLLQPDQLQNLFQAITVRSLCHRFRRPDGKACVQLSVHVIVLPAHGHSRFHRRIQILRQGKLRAHLIRAAKQQGNLSLTLRQRSRIEYYLQYG